MSKPSISHDAVVTAIRIAGQYKPRVAIEVPVRPRKLRRILIAAGVGGAVSLIGCGWAVGPARADTVADNYTVANAWRVCATLDDFPSPAGVFGVMGAIQNEGLTVDQSAAVMWESALGWCPRHLDLLNQITGHGATPIAVKR